LFSKFNIGTQDNSTSERLNELSRLPSLALITMSDKVESWQGGLHLNVKHKNDDDCVSATSIEIQTCSQTLGEIPYLEFTSPVFKCNPSQYNSYPFTMCMKHQKGLLCFWLMDLLQTDISFSASLILFYCAIIVLSFYPVQFTNNIFNTTVYINRIEKANRLKRSVWIYTPPCGIKVKAFLLMFLIS